MEIKENSQKKVLLSVLGVAILVVAVVGISFAAFTLTQTSHENVVTTGTLMVSYSEDAQEIDINDALPMSDADALKSSNLKAEDESFLFTVSTNASASSSGVTIPYSISLTPIALTTEETEAGNTALANTEIKVFLTKDGTAVSEFLSSGNNAPKLVSALTSYTGHSRTGTYLLHSDSDAYTTAGGSTTSEYVLKMWIDENATVDMTSENSRIYKAKVNVDSDVTPVSSINPAS